MAKRSMFVGMDVHKESIDVSIAEEGRALDRRFLSTANTAAWSGGLTYRPITSVAFCSKSGSSDASIARAIRLQARALPRFAD